MNMANCDKGIAIFWFNTIEYIDIDFETFSEKTNISHTEEWDLEEKILRKYNTVSTVNKISDLVFKLVLKYEIKHNVHLDVEEVCWGTSEIELNLTEKKGHTIWTDYNDSTYNGKSEWRRLDLPLVGDRRRVTSTKLQREQAKFRKLLLAIDSECQITKETTFEVLEAAHIIPVSEGGIETIGNGLILRADIHKLYDSGKFRITGNGDIEITGELSDDYIDLFKKAKIEKSTIDRIKSALNIKNNNSPNE